VAMPIRKCKKGLSKHLHEARRVRLLPRRRHVPCVRDLLACAHRLGARLHGRHITSSPPALNSSSRAASCSSTCQQALQQIHSCATELASKCRLSLTAMRPSRRAFTSKAGAHPLGPLLLLAQQPALVRSLQLLEAAAAPLLLLPPAAAEQRRWLETIHEGNTGHLPTD
jgi:hypothetical protein